MKYFYVSAVIKNNDGNVEFVTAKVTFPKYPTMGEIIDAIRTNKDLNKNEPIAILGFTEMTEEQFDKF